MTFFRNHQKKQQRSLSLVAAALTASCIGLFAGCGGRTSRNATEESGQNSVGRSTDRVIAQGQILPSGGVIRLAAPPGDIVQQVHVQVGQTVSRNTLLVTMRSQAVRQVQRAAMEKRRAEAIQHQQLALQAANRQIAAAQLKIDQIAAQQEAIARQANLLDLAKGQVDAAERLLEKLKAIASDPLTREFLGQLEIDRQQMAVSEAQLNYRSRVETLRQEQLRLEWETEAAKLDLDAAEAARQATESNQALDVVEAELAVLDAQDAAATIASPVDGVVVAINASAGESSVQRPLIEIADTSRLVCEVEVYQTDAALIRPGQSARISSHAFPQPLKGVVIRRGQLVGRPQLQQVDPLARVDYRTVHAIIELDEKDRQQAAQWLQLQVEVEIDVGRLVPLKLDQPPASASRSNKSQIAT